MQHFTPAFWALCLTLTVFSSASPETVTGPGSAFVLQLPGQWASQPVRDGVVAWTAVQAGQPAAAVILAAAPFQEGEPLADQLERLVRSPEAEFTGARNFTRAPMTILGVTQEVVCFTYTQDGEDFAVHAVAFAAGGQHHAVLVIGRDGQPDLRSFAVSVFSSIRPFSGAEPAALPPGWRVRELGNALGVEAFKTQEPDTLVRVQVLPGDGRGATALLRQALGSERNKGPHIERVARTDDDRFARCTYLKTDGPRMVQGDAAVALGEREGLLALFEAPKDQLETRRSELQKVLRALLAGKVPEVGGEGHPAPPTADQVCLTQTPNADHSAWISVPQGWQVTESQGMVHAFGPEGTVMVGIWGMFLSRAAEAMYRQAGMDPAATPAVAFADFQPAPQALHVILPHIGRLTGGAIGNVEILAAEPLDTPGFVRAHVRFQWQQGAQAPQNMEGLAFVSSTPAGDSWTWTLTLLTAPQADFPATLPLLLRIYQTYGVSPALIQERLENIRRIQEETSQIIQDVTAYREQVAEGAHRKWVAYIRGVTPTIDPATGEQRDIAGLEDIQRWADENPTLDVGKLRPVYGDEWYQK